VNNSFFEKKESGANEKSIAVELISARRD